MLGPQPSDHTAQDEQASQQDVHSLARLDRGLLLRRDASAELAQSHGSAVATATAQWRRRATPTRRNSSLDSAATPPHRRCSPPSENGGQAPGKLLQRRLPAPREGTHFHLRSRGGQRSPPRVPVPECLSPRQGLTSCWGPGRHQLRRHRPPLPTSSSRRHSNRPW